MSHYPFETALVSIVAGILAGCTILGPAPSDLSVEMIFCAGEINRYRALVDLPSLLRSPALEAYATESAAVDGLAGRAHLHFYETNGGGVALAETELLSWQTVNVHAVIERGLQLMWDEGPAGEHRMILTGPYSQVGCGAFVGGQRVTVVQSFR